jgi:outer membrane protein OmpA-like peptidoglycan-associated protein
MAAASWLGRLRQGAIATLAAAAGIAAAGSELDTRSIIEALRLPVASPAVVGEAGRSRNLAVVARGPAEAAERFEKVDKVDKAEKTERPERAEHAPESPSLSLALVFASNSAELSPQNGHVLGQLVAALLSPELRSQRFLIEGHSDARGQAAANQRLSLERAEEVRQYLVALGVPAGRLRATGRGAQSPANPADPAAAENRRVRVVALP